MLDPKSLETRMIRHSLLAATLGFALTACGQPQNGSAPAENLAAPASAKSISPQISLTKISDAEFPWGMAFLPSGDLVFTEKENGLKWLSAACATGALDASTEAACTPTPITGLPPALTTGQAGYLGLTTDPAFAENNTLYIAYSKGAAKANATVVLRATFNAAENTLEDVSEIFVADERAAPAHFGSRLQFADADTLFVSLGDAYVHMEDAQTPINTHGTLIRIKSDGSIPTDNPFADGEGGHPAVWSYGHRNSQGLYFDAETNTLYATEHGPKGGDEFNMITKGANYGWPAITYGIDYSGAIISKHTEKEGMQQPLSYWVPSIAPSGLTRLTTNLYDGWKGDFLVGGMNGPEGLKLVRLDMEDGKVAAREDLLTGEYSIRDVIEGPDGHVYLATKDLNGLFRLDVAE